MSDKTKTAEEIMEQNFILLLKEFSLPIYKQTDWYQNKLNWYREFADASVKAKTEELEGKVYLLELAYKTRNNDYELLSRRCLELESQLSSAKDSIEEMATALSNFIEFDNQPQFNIRLHNEAKQALTNYQKQK